jgi:integrase/recombinase XerD
LPSLDDRYELRRKIAYAIQRLNKAMIKLMEMIGSTKNASQHKARHSFAQRAEEKDIHPKVLQKMYRHESILTTMKYQSNFSFKKADDAIDAVLDF